MNMEADNPEKIRNVGENVVPIVSPGCFSCTSLTTRLDSGSSLVKFILPVPSSGAFHFEPSQSNCHSSPDVKPCLVRAACWFCTHNTAIKVWLKMPDAFGTRQYGPQNIGTSRRCCKTSIALPSGMEQTMKMITGCSALPRSA